MVEYDEITCHCCGHSYIPMVKLSNSKDVPAVTSGTLRYLVCPRCYGNWSKYWDRQISVEQLTASFDVRKEKVGQEYVRQ